MFMCVCVCVAESVYVCVCIYVCMCHEVVSTSTGTYFWQESMPLLSRAVTSCDDVIIPIPLFSGTQMLQTLTSQMC